MPVQMIELEEATMVEVGDEALEASGRGALFSSSLPCTPDETTLKPLCGP